MNGFTFDRDGHLLHFRHRYTFDLVRQLLGDNLCEHARSAWIYSCGSYIRYPFQANLHGLPSSVVKECLLGFVNTRTGLSGEKARRNFKEWIYRTFGRGMARHFFIPYNTKFWTLQPRQLTCEWLDGFIPVPSLSEIIEGTVEESRRQFGYNARFWYPRHGGIDEVPRALAARLRHVYTGLAVTGIDLVRKKIRLAGGAQEPYDYLIYTLPLPEVPGLAEGIAPSLSRLFRKLRWNSVFNVNLGIDRREASGRHWVYFPEKEYSFFRVGFFHNLSSHLAPPDKGSLYVEVSYSEQRPIEKKKILVRIKQDLIKAGILDPQDRVCAQDINDIHYGYPIYDSHYSLTRSEILRFLLGHGVIPCGRYGSWRYMSMEDALRDGKEAAARCV